MTLCAPDTPSMSLPSIPSPALLNDTAFGGSTRPLSRGGSEPASLAPWEVFETQSDDEHEQDQDVDAMIVRHGIALPIQLEQDNSRVSVVMSVERTARWRQNVSGWQSSSPGHGTSRSNRSSYTSVYPLSTSPSFTHSQSTFFDSDPPLSTSSVVYSDDGGTFGCNSSEPQPDWAPWLPNSPSSRNRLSSLFDDNVGPLLSHRPRPLGGGLGPGFRRSILRTSNTFYLPPLFVESQRPRPTFATPRRNPTTSRPDSPVSTASSSSASSRARESCFPSPFSMCTSRGKTRTTPKPEVDNPPVIGRTPPSATARGKGGYRISFVQDRQWRANILNQAVEQSLITSTLFPAAPKSSLSKYEPRAKHSTHRSKGTREGDQAPRISLSVDKLRTGQDIDPPLIFEAAEQARGHPITVTITTPISPDTTTSTNTFTSPPNSTSDTTETARPEPKPERNSTCVNKRNVQEFPTRDVQTPVACPEGLRFIWMYPEEAFERLSQRPASPSPPDS